MIFVGRRSEYGTVCGWALPNKILLLYIIRARCDVSDIEYASMNRIRSLFLHIDRVKDLRISIEYLVRREFEVQFSDELIVYVIWKSYMIIHMI